MIVLFDERIQVIICRRNGRMLKGYGVSKLHVINITAKSAFSYCLIIMRILQCQLFLFFTSFKRPYTISHQALSFPLLTEFTVSRMPIYFLSIQSWETNTPEIFIIRKIWYASNRKFSWQPSRDIN